MCMEFCLHMRIHNMSRVSLEARSLHRIPWNEGLGLLWTATWVPGTEPRSSGRVFCALNHSDIPPAHSYYFKILIHLCVCDAVTHVFNSVCVCGFVFVCVGLCGYMCTTVCIWRAGDSHGCWSLPSALFERDLLAVYCCVWQAAWSMSFWKLSCLPLAFPWRTTDCAAVLSCIQALRIETQLLKLGQ